MTVLAVQHVSYSYAGRRALVDAAFTVEAGRVTMLLGPNGAGKSTLFSLITRLLAMQSGTIMLAGQNIATAPDAVMSNLGIVFQQSALDLDLTVEQNLRYFAGLHGMKHGVADAAIMRVLSPFDLLARRSDKVRLLNGGHRRRVEIARALMTNPQLLLLDEPTVGLDMPTRRALVDAVHRLAAADGIAVLWATHLADEVQPQDDLVVLVEGTTRATGRCEHLLKDAKAKSVEGYFNMMLQMAAA